MMQTPTISTAMFLAGQCAANAILLSASDYSDRATGHFVTIEGQAIFLHGPRPSDSAGRKAQFHEAVANFHRKEAGKASNPAEKNYHEKSAAIHDIHAKAQGEIAKVTGETPAAKPVKEYSPPAAVAEKHAEAMGKGDSGKDGDGKAEGKKAAESVVSEKPTAKSIATRAIAENQSSRWASREARNAGLSESDVRDELASQGRTKGDSGEAAASAKAQKKVDDAKADEVKQKKWKDDLKAEKDAAEGKASADRNAALSDKTEPHWATYHEALDSSHGYNEAMSAGKHGDFGDVVANQKHRDTFEKHLDSASDHNDFSKSIAKSVRASGHATEGQAKAIALASAKRKTVLLGAEGKKAADSEKDIANEAAASDVVAKGKIDKNEHIVVLDSKTGKHLASGTDGSGAVEIPKVDSTAFDVHHNHPDNSSFSRQDIGAFVDHPGMQTLYAHGHDGRSYEATKIPGKERELWLRSDKLYAKAHSDALDQWMNSGSKDKAAGMALRVEKMRAVPQQLHDEGLIKYRTWQRNMDKEPAPGAQAANRAAFSAPASAVTEGKKAADSAAGQESSLDQDREKLDSIREKFAGTTHPDNIHVSPEDIDVARRVFHGAHEAYYANRIKRATHDNMKAEAQVVLSHADRMAAKKAAFSAPASAVTPGVFGQSTVSAGTGKQNAMFDTSKPVDAGKIGGSKNALDPKNTTPLPFDAKESGKAAADSVVKAKEPHEMTKAEYEAKNKFHQGMWNEVQNTATHVDRNNPNQLITATKSASSPGKIRVGKWDERGPVGHTDVDEENLASHLKEHAYKRGDKIVSVEGGIGGTKPSESYAGMGYRPDVTSAKGVVSFVGPAEHAEWMTGRLASGGYRSSVSDVPEEIVKTSGVATHRGLKGVVDHSIAVHRALADGKTVPAEVLKDYPELAKKYGKSEPFSAPASAITPGIFGQSTVSAGTGKQNAMFDTSKPVDAGKIGGSKNALDPKNTTPLPFDAKESGKAAADSVVKALPGNAKDAVREMKSLGVTVKPNKLPVYQSGMSSENKARADKILDSGVLKSVIDEKENAPPSHTLVKDPIKAGKGFTRTELHSKILSHHAEMTGGDVAAQHEFDRSGRGTGQTTFHKELPSEVKTYLEGNKGATRLFRTTQNASQSGGADSMGHLGEDKYFAHIDRMSGSNMNAALDTARKSQDPEMQFSAAIHDNLPEGNNKSKITNIDASRLKVGREFTFGGQPMRVIEDDDGHKVLHGFGEEFPLDALKSIPVDRGSFRKTKMQSDDIAPFSYDTDDQTIYLHSPLELKPAVTLGQGRPNEINGQPVKYFWADGIRAGDYTHPTKGFSLSVNRKRIDGWIENFHKMRGNDVDIHACADHSEKARDSLGYVVDMKRDGDTLKVLHQLIGEDAIRMASRNKISLGIHPNFKDGRGNVYGDSIVHSALTPVPVVPSSEGLIAASRGQQTEPVILTLAALRSTAMPFSAQQLDEIRKLPGAGEIPEDGAAAWLLSYAQTTAQNVVTLSIRVQSAEAQIQTLSSEDEVTKLSTENESLRTRVQELSAAIPEPVPETALFLMSQSLQTEREAAIASGGIDPATAKLLETMLTNADGKPSVMALSMTRDTKAPVGFELWRALRNNKPINVEHKTGVQALSMATEPPPKPASQDDVANAKEVEETRRMLHLPPKK